MPIPKPERPKAIADWRKYLRFWGRDVQRDIDDELQFHLDMREQDFVASGLSEPDARDATLARFGSVDDVAQNLRSHDLNRERARQRAERFETVVQDVRYGVRKLLQAPGFTVAVVLVLALGIGINSAIFSAVDAALLRPLPFRDAERLVLIDNMRLPPTMRINGAPPVKRRPDITDVAGLTDVVQGVGAYATGALNLSGRGDPVRVKVALTTTSLLTTLSVVPELGRTFLDEEGREGGADVVMLSHGLWKRQYAGDSSIVGKTVLLNGVAHTVVGIMPEKFRFPSGTEIWVPLTVPFLFKGARAEAFRSFMELKAIAKLAPGVSSAVAGKRVRALFEPYATAARPIVETAEKLVVPLQQTLVSGRKTALLVLMGAAALVLLTACANVTNLLLSRSATRQRELEIRAALGASRSRIIQQLLTESVLLSLAGGLLGIGFAYGGLQLLTLLMPPELVDVTAPTIDARVLGFSLVLATLTGLVFGLWPALGAARSSTAATNSNRKAASYAATARDGRVVRRIFVVSEVAFALMLLIGAGLMLRSFSHLLRTNTGVDVDRIAVVELNLPKSRYPDKASVLAFHTAVLERVRRMPGVEAAASINEIPLRGEAGIGISAQAEGAVPDPNVKELYPQYLRITPDYFRTMGIRVIAGRVLNERDDGRESVAVINQAMANVLWPGKNAVGMRFAFGTLPGEPPVFTTVIGVTSNVRALTIEAEAKPQMFFPFIQSPTNIAGIVVRGSGDTHALLAALSSAVRTTDPDQAMSNLQMLEQAVSRTIAPRRLNTMLIVLFGLLAVTLSAVGVYAVIAYGVARRTREIGIRLALGAGVGSVLRMVMREGVALGLIGVAIGLLGAWALSRLLESMLFGVSVRDP
ncbi:MAG: ABC transporter permease, partial [Gemmatimonas sp.]